MNISDERLAKDNALAMNDLQCSRFANGQSLMQGTFYIANCKFLTTNITNESRS